MNYPEDMDGADTPDPQDADGPDDFAELTARRREERLPVEEAGGGQAEGFELSEQELIDHASHGDEHRPFRIMRDAGPQEEVADSVYGEADEEHHVD
jgi:hypothetical protein